jgi:hypothetical protein
MQSILSISTYDHQGKGMNYADLFLELSTVSSACARGKLRLFQDPIAARISNLQKSDFFKNWTLLKFLFLQGFKFLWNMKFSFRKSDFVQVIFPHSDLLDNEVVSRQLSDFYAKDGQ